MNYGFIVAGTNSGCGKTTVTTGLMRLLARKKYRIAPFKTGPDYIDPAFHSHAAGSQSHNLDTFMLGHQTVKELFALNSKNKDIAVVEGVMGLFDGMGNECAGSTAELAKTLNLPVILVVNCKALYQSIAAIVHGFCSFDKQLRIAGVILNHVYTEEQYAFLKQYIETTCGVACLGYLPVNSEISLESRHLGLIQANELSDLLAKTDKIADLLEKHVDVEKLLQLCTTGNPDVQPSMTYTNISLNGLKLGVAFDKAFSFYYQANLDLLKQCGAQLIYFSPLNDPSIPDNVDALYLGGGYPEVFIHELSNNHSMIQSIRRAASKGMAIYGECGGLMYLTNGIVTKGGQFHHLCGIFNCHSEMTERLQRFGYCQVEWQGQTTIAHEFHHSKLIEQTESNYIHSFHISRKDKNKYWTGGLRTQNVLAGYPHIHFYSNIGFFEELCHFFLGK